MTESHYHVLFCNCGGRQNDLQIQIGTKDGENLQQTTDGVSPGETLFPYDTLRSTDWSVWEGFTILICYFQVVEDGVQVETLEAAPSLRKFLLVIPDQYVAYGWGSWDYPFRCTDCCTLLLVQFSPVRFQIHAYKGIDFGLTPMNFTSLRQ